MFRINNDHKKSIYLILLFLAIFLVSHGPAMAKEGAETTNQSGTHDTHEVASEGGEEGGHGADRSADLRDLLYRFINFTLLVIILVWVLRKVGIKSFFNKRTEEIRQRLDDLKREKEETEGKYKEIESKLRDFEKERDTILEGYRKEGQAEKEKIIAEARERVQQIIEQGELTIQQEIQAARDRLRRNVVDLASQNARDIIAKEIKEEDQDHLVNDFIERVGKIH